MAGYDVTKWSDEAKNTLTLILTITIKQGKQVNYNFLKC